MHASNIGLSPILCAAGKMGHETHERLDLAKLTVVPVDAVPEVEDGVSQFGTPEIE